MFIIDTIATVVFFTVIVASTELFIAGMALREVLITRLIMIHMIVLTGAPMECGEIGFLKSLIRLLRGAELLLIVLHSSRRIIEAITGYWEMI